MQKDTNHALALLANSGIDFVKRDDLTAPPLKSAQGEWSFTTSDDRIAVWVYEFADQREMENIIFADGEDFQRKFDVVDFSQNGEFLLVVRLGNLGELPRDEYLVSAITQKFAGEIER